MSSLSEAIEALTEISHSLPVPKLPRIDSPDIHLAFSKIEIFSGTNMMPDLGLGRIEIVETMIQGPTRTYKDRPSSPEEDFQWLLSNPAELAGHKGQYVAILDKRIVTYGTNMGDVVDAMSKQKLRRRPVLAFIPQESAQAFFH